MADLKEQGICVALFFKLGINATESFRMLRACFEEQTVGRTQVCLVVFQV
jgi:hypothetical protein